MSSLLPTASSDYTAVNQMNVTLTPMKTSSCVEVEINQDQILEMDEEFILRLTSNIPTVTLQPAETEITIRDDDGMPGF